MGIIAFMSDFGLEDYYVGAVKAVIKRVCPSSEVVDITHAVAPWSLLEADYLLSCCYDDFPSGTIFLVVVDPGVGTSRRALIAKTRDYWFIGPDNGVFSGVLEKSSNLELWSIRSVPHKHKSSTTFHGRDVFAPVAAHISCGGRVEDVGERVTDYVRLNKPPTRLEGDILTGYVAHIDRFGNVATSIDKGLLEDAGIEAGSMVGVWVGNRYFELSVLRTFGEAGEGELFALINSCEKLEFAVNKGRASDKLSVRVGDTLRVKRL
ncbi:MAG: SAM hydrolase/SAM-dependent halogenase family protein [Infirmifilum sp.]